MEANALANHEIKRKWKHVRRDSDLDLGVKVSRKHVTGPKPKDNQSTPRKGSHAATPLGTDDVDQDSNPPGTTKLNGSKAAIHHLRHDGLENPTKNGSPTKSGGKDKMLPITAHRTDIISAVIDHSVLILTGETGSGKSTQLPQYLLDAPFLAGRPPSHGAFATNIAPSIANHVPTPRKLKIAVTQPRRVAATSLASRVAKELHSPLGKTPNARVGYSVRFDSNLGRDNEIVYLTEGMLLMELLRDPGLTQYGVVVVDEVHERGVDVDLLMGFLKQLIHGQGEGARRRKDKLGNTPGASLRIVVMSATADVETLEQYFSTRQDASPGTTETVPSHVGKIAKVRVEGRQYPVEVTYLPRPTQDYVEAALKTVFQIHCKEPMPGDVLVFLTGQETIQGLQRNIEEYAQSLGPELPELVVLPIYAALPQAAQQRVFEPAPPRTRKIILATNIAETSITVPGVRFVIDCGKEKRKQFRPRLGLESLLVKAISKSSAIQRKGRAGREAPGKCWRLYTEKDHDRLEDTKAPEIMRCDLSDAVLKMKAIGIPDVLNFPLLTSPTQEAMARSLLQLLQLNALTDSGEISNVGRSMSRFPLSPSYACVLLAAASSDLSCLLPVLDIVSCFSADNTVFLNADTEEAREQAAASRASLLRRQGDHITLLAVVQAYASEHTDRKAWCRARHISHRGMQAIMDIRKQLRAQCQSQQLLSVEQTVEYDRSGTASTDEDTAARVLKCFIKGFRQNTARLMPDGSYRTFIGNQNVAVHPSSVLFGSKVEAIVYAEFVYTNRTYARGVGVVQAGWVGEVFES